MFNKKSISLLLDLSREFGSDPRYVIAGGGNSSIKDGSVMYVKGSGSRMGTITADGFVAMDLGRMSVIWEKPYSKDADRREEEVLVDLLASRKPGEEQKRPSVEALLHALFPQPLVMHTHPALVNGLTCGVDGEKEAASLFGENAVWIPLVEPGYILAKYVRDAMSGAGGFRNIVFLQNHGVFVAAQTPEEIRSLYRDVFSTIGGKVKTLPDAENVEADISPVPAILEAFKAVPGDPPLVLPFMDRILSPLLESKESFSVLEHPLTPDHMVYAGFLPLFVERMQDLPDLLVSYMKMHKELPRIIAVQNGCCYSCTKTNKGAQDARDLFLDAAMVVAYSRFFGGPRPMTERLVTFIRNWEVEKYRQNKA